LASKGRESKDEEDWWIKIKAKVHLSTSFDEK
jgi:cytochrome b involved in lipid metabolism